MNHPSNENIPSRSFSYHAFNFTFLLLLAVFFISLYTAKRDPDGKPIYLIDGLDLDAASDGTNDILGALCIEIDIEDTYRSIEAINRSSLGIAVATSLIALLLIVISYFYTQKQKSRELAQQQLLEQTAKAAEAANKAKSIFLFNMSHDIRTPMNAILGYAELARNHLQEPEKLGEYMDKIHISGEKLLSIINNILQFSQIENNQTHIEETSVQTEESFDSCIVMVQTALEAGMNDHVAKPIDMKVLMNVLEEQICGRKGS